MTATFQSTYIFHNKKITVIVKQIDDFSAIPQVLGTTNHTINTSVYSI